MAGNGTRRDVSRAKCVKTVARPSTRGGKKKQKTERGGGARRDRTADLLHAMQALSQLSYGPKKTRHRTHTKRARQAKQSRVAICLRLERETFSTIKYPAVYYSLKRRGCSVLMT
jgi:hypothetical protein